MKKKKINSLYIIIAVLAIVVLSSQTSLFSFIIDDAFTLQVTEYVDSSGTASKSKLTSAFEDIGEFNLRIDESYDPEDVLVYVVDANAQEKLIFAQMYTPSCVNNGPAVTNHPMASTKFSLFHDENVVYLKNVYTDKLVNYVTKDSSFGVGPYKIKFVVTNIRTYICGSSGQFSHRGIIYVDNILLENLEPVNETPVENNTPAINQTELDLLNEQILALQQDKNSLANQLLQLQDELDALKDADNEEPVTTDLGQIWADYQLYILIGAAFVVLLLLMAARKR